jgi:DNA-binding LacI/PurR family transcriptional regulator
MDSMLRRDRGTIEDVVRLSGVSRSSVFRYLSGKSLRPAIRDAVEAAMSRSGYSPGAFQPTAQSAAGFEILVSSSSALGGFRGYAEVVEGVMARAGEMGIGVRLSAGDGGRAVDAASGERTVVVILGKSISEEESEIRELRKRGIPFVLVNRRIEELDGLPVNYASADFRAAAAEAVGHLLDRGRRRVALWDDGSAFYRVAREKLEGWRSAYATRGLAAPEELLARRSAEGLEEAAPRLFALKADAWFAMDDEAALRAIRAASARGLRVPEDLAVASVNDSEAARLSHPSVTSVRIPFFEAGRSAADILARVVERSSETSVRILLGHTLMLRETSPGPKEGSR